MLKKTKIGILIAITIVLIVYGAFGYLLYRLHSLNIAGTALAKEVTTLSQKEKDTEKLKDTISTTEEKRLLLDSYFVSHDTVATFLDALEQLGTVAGVDFTIASVNEKIQDKNPILSIQVNAKGTFQQVYNLVSLLEVAPYEFQFETVNLTAGGDSDSDSATGAVLETPWEARIVFNLLTFIP